MPWQAERDEAFDKSVKILCKRFPRAEDDILDEFKSGPPQATDALPKYGRKLWKGRAASTDLSRGKSGSFRVIYYYDEALPNWCCIGACYFKGDKESLPADELDRLFVGFKARLKRFLKAVEEMEQRAKAGDQQPDSE